MKDENESKKELKQSLCHSLLQNWMKDGPQLLVQNWVTIGPRLLNLLINHIVDSNSQLSYSLSLFSSTTSSGSLNFSTDSSAQKLPLSFPENFSRREPSLSSFSTSLNFSTNSVPVSTTLQLSSPDPLDSLDLRNIPDFPDFPDTLPLNFPIESRDLSSDLNIRHLDQKDAELSQAMNVLNWNPKRKEEIYNILLAIISYSKDNIKSIVKLKNALWSTDNFLKLKQIFEKNKPNDEFLVAISKIKINDFFLIQVFRKISCDACLFNICLNSLIIKAKSSVEERKRLQPVFWALQDKFGTVDGFFDNDNLKILNSSDQFRYCKFRQYSRHAPNSNYFLHHLIQISRPDRDFFPQVRQLRIDVLSRLLDINKADGSKEPPPANYVDFLSLKLHNKTPLLSLIFDLYNTCVVTHALDESAFKFYNEVLKVLLEKDMNSNLTLKLSPADFKFENENITQTRSIIGTKGGGLNYLVVLIYYFLATRQYAMVAAVLQTREVPRDFYKTVFDFNRSYLSILSPTELIPENILPSMIIIQKDINNKLTYFYNANGYGVGGKLTLNKCNKNIILNSKTAVITAFEKPRLFFDISAACGYQPIRNDTSLINIIAQDDILLINHLPLYAVCDMSLLSVIYSNAIHMNFQNPAAQAVLFCVSSTLGVFANFFPKVLIAIILEYLELNKNEIVSFNSIVNNPIFKSLMHCYESKYVRPVSVVSKRKNPILFNDFEGEVEMKSNSYEAFPNNKRHRAMNNFSGSSSSNYSPSFNFSTGVKKGVGDMPVYRL